MPEVWDKLSTESPQAHNAFCRYRDLGPNRTLLTAYLAHRALKVPRQAPSGTARAPGNPPVQAPGNWRAWCSQHRWHERAIAWDARDQQVAQRAREAAIADLVQQEVETDWKGRRKQQRETEWQLGGDLIELAQKMIKINLHRVKKVSDDGKTTVLEPAKWNLGTMAKIVDLATKLRRLANDMPPTISQIPTDAANADVPFFEADAQVADMIGGGVVPAMPEDVGAKPDLSSTIAREAEGRLTQIGKMPRPGDANGERP